MTHSKLIRNCIGTIIGTALGANFSSCAGDKPIHFRTNNIPSITIPVGECRIYSGSELCYRGMDTTLGVFYLNDGKNSHKVNADTLRHPRSYWDNNINLFVIEGVTPDSLTIRNVGFNAYP